MTDDDDIPIMRVPISLPCQVPVLPGTPDTDAPIEERTERCAVDAWWMVGRAMICDLHFREVFGGDYPDDVEPNATERKPWAEMRRYPQEQAMPEWERAS